MTHIYVIGVTSLFLPLVLRHRSKRALVVMINGILFHSYDKNNLLRYYDIFCNLLICFYSGKENKLIRPLLKTAMIVVLAFCNYMYNMYFSLYTVR